MIILRFASIAILVSASLLQVTSAGTLGPLTYTDNGTSITITEHDRFEGGNVIIPAMIDGKPVTVIGGDAFSRSRNVASVTLPEFITTIGDRAFANCSKLTSITLPPGLNSLGIHVFEWCTQLEVVEIGSALTEIPSGMFYRCAKLQRIRIPSSVTRIGSASFLYCANLKSIRIPEAVTEIGPTAFLGCKSLEKVTIPASVRSVGKNAFSISGLSRLTLKEGVRLIGSGAFAECKNLSSLVLPASVKEIEWGAFAECPRLPGVILLGDAPKVGKKVFGKPQPGFKVLIVEGAKGFTYPKWEGYKVSLPAPEITVQVGNESNVVAADFRSNFGYSEKDRRGKTVRCTISNTGTLPLRKLSLALSGNGASDFKINGKTRKSLMPGKSTTFSITFKPEVRGKRRAVLSILSNDPDENPFEVNLRGTAVVPIN